MEIRFYDVGRGRLPRVLRLMLEKTLSRGVHSVVRFQRSSRAAELDAYLWNEPMDGFLPHALADDRLYSSEGSSVLLAEQPIILTTSKEVINGARALFHWQEGNEEGSEEGNEDGSADGIGGLAADFPIGADNNFDLCCFLFSSGDGGERVALELWERAMLSARTSARTSGSEGGADISVNFWVDSGGSWVKREFTSEANKANETNETKETSEANKTSEIGDKQGNVEGNAQEQALAAKDSPASDQTESSPTTANPTGTDSSEVADAGTFSRRQESLL